VSQPTNSWWVEPGCKIFDSPEKWVGLAHFDTLTYW